MNIKQKLHHIRLSIPPLAFWVREGIEELHGSFVDIIIAVNWRRFILGVLTCLALGLLTGAGCAAPWLTGGY